MIDLKKVNLRYRREITAPFYYSEDGEAKTAQIRVSYLSQSVKDAKEKFADAKATLPELLLARELELPDLTDNGKPITVTLEFLESLDPKNLMALQEAINNDIYPK